MPGTKKTAASFAGVLSDGGLSSKRASLYLASNGVSGNHSVNNSGQYSAHHKQTTSKHQSLASQSLYDSKTSAFVSGSGSVPKEKDKHFSAI